MEKIENCYMKALEELNKSFLKARTAHTALSNEFMEAESEWRKQPKIVPEWDHTRHAQKAAAGARYQAASDGLQTKVEQIWMDYSREIAKIRAALVDEVAEADTLKACEIDPAAVSLLNSGVMKARDYQKMAEQYSGNAAVLALVRKGAREYADSLRDGINDADNTRERLAALSAAENAKTGGEIALQNFDNWVSTTNTLSGRDSYGSFYSMDRIKYPVSLSGWESVLQSHGLAFGDSE